MNRASSMIESFERLYGSTQRFNAAMRPEKPKCPCGMYALEDVTPPFKGTLQQSVALMHEEECKTSVLRSTLFKTGFCNISRAFKKSNFERLGVEVREEKTFDRRSALGTRLFLDELWVPAWVATILDAQLPRRRRDKAIKLLLANEPHRDALRSILETRSSSGDYIDRLRHARNKPNAIRAYLESIL